MQTQNPILDEIAKLTTAAMGMAQAAGEEAKAAFRSQTDRLVAEMDPRREDHDALKAEVAALRAEIDALKAAAKPKKAARRRDHNACHANAARPSQELADTPLKKRFRVCFAGDLGRRSALRPSRKAS